tara:strand:+ start:4835 stop:6025 length:1191 start_codon:yes stop_codon:yes gene_type:complete
MLPKSIFRELVKVNYRFSYGSYQSQANRESQEKRDFLAAAEYVYDNFVTVPIGDWSPEQFIEVLINTHRILASELLASRKTGSGQLRETGLFVLRANKDDDCGYQSQNQVMAMTKYLMKKGRSKNEAIHFMIAFHKFFYVMSTANGPQREFVNRLGTQRAASMLLRVDIGDDKLTSKCFTEAESGAFDLFFKCYPEPEQLMELLTQCAGETLETLREAPKSAATKFFFDFLNVKPFLDGNGRLARLIANAIQVKYDLPVINLNTKDARLAYEHFFATDVTADEINRLFDNLINKVTVLDKPLLDNMLKGKFMETYGDKLRWESSGEGFNGNIRLVSHKISEAMKNWLSPKLRGSIYHFDPIASDGPVKYQLVIYNIDHDSFNMDAMQKLSNVVQPG